LKAGLVNCRHICLCFAVKPNSMPFVMSWSHLHFPHKIKQFLADMDHTTHCITPSCHRAVHKTGC